MKTDLQGRVALVTGATGGLGRSVVRALAREGATVVGTYHGEPSRDLEAHVHAQIACDARDEASVAQAFNAAKTGGRAASIVIHLAGGFGTDGTIGETSVKTWNSMMDLNLKSSFLVVREAVRTMHDAAYGRIVLVSALGALTAGTGAVAYKVSKAGLKTLLETAHAEMKGGVTINALAPLIIDTPQNRKDMPKADRSSWVTTDALADAVVFLCSPAGGSISGTIIPFP